ncbi:MAG TPA: hypothetical protein VGT44_06390 [Ktedonobacteraceae bacterium]|nr:hypothetical protein [Ktedonobacteraceae bacterium]
MAILGPGSVSAPSNHDTGEATPHYQEFPPVTIGGPTGDYSIVCPVTSGRWAEFAIDSIVNGDGGTGALVISGRNPPKALAYDGSVKIDGTNDSVFLYATPIRIPATTTLHPNSAFERITSSEKRVYMRIDAAASTSIYVTLRFRLRILERIPAPAATVHPDHAHNMNKERARATNERLQAMGIPGYAKDGSKDRD